MPRRAFLALLPFLALWLTLAPAHASDGCVEVAQKIWGVGNLFTAAPAECSSVRGDCLEYVSEQEGLAFDFPEAAAICKARIDRVCLEGKKQSMKPADYTLEAAADACRSE